MPEKMGKDEPLNPTEGLPIPDPLQITETVGKIAEKSQQIIQTFLDHQSTNGKSSDPMNIGAAFLEMTSKMMSDPEKIIQAQASLWQDYMQLWSNAARSFSGEQVEPMATPEKGDRRFKHEEWEENGVFDYFKQSYLLTSRWFVDTVRDVDGLDDKTAKKVDFYSRQFMDALSPSNFVLTNPEVLRATLESNGENLVKGLDNMIDDLEKGKGKLKISMTDHKAFKVGENLALTPGKVVYQNELMQLIQYEPTTKQVHRRPLLIMPPWINKYYILDLSPKNSFIQWAVGEGLTVFIISWVNPDERLSHKSFDDYMLEGPLAALDAIEKATGEREVNMIGYCIGGTLLACMLSYMKAKGDERVTSATYFTTLLDFTDAGELSVFIDEEQLAALEHEMKEKGYLEGHSMATTFNMLRANDLIWSFVVNNYLLGKDPFPFDLLFWNSDSTRMPADMHSFYLRAMYHDNLMVKPGGITLAGVPIDISKIDVPSFLLSTREDHIAPWHSTYAAVNLFKGPVNFVLSASGHIAGVINPPQAGKYNYWTNSQSPEDPDEWFELADAHEGSWWPEWSRWVAEFGGGKVKARKPGDGKLKVIEDAPGHYILPPEEQKKTAKGKKTKAAKKKKS